MAYSLDASALIVPWRDQYPPRIFKGFWERYDEMIIAGQAVAVDEVYKEIEKKDDDLKEWVRDRLRMFVALEEDIQLAVTEVLTLSERMVGSQKGRNAADPWVIALAKVRGLTVVTMERASGNLNRPKIPDVCDTLSVPCIDVIGLVDKEGWQF